MGQNLCYQEYELLKTKYYYENKIDISAKITGFIFQIL